MTISRTHVVVVFAVVLSTYSWPAEQRNPKPHDRAVSIHTNVLSEGVNEIWFKTKPGVVYRVEQSSNEVWSLSQRIVAEAEKFEFIPTAEEAAYRVFEEDDRIQFPDWFDRIQQYLRFDVWTPVKGRYRLELYANGTLVYATNRVVPSHGYFGVHDAGYDPAKWPSAGYYAVNVWELRITVTPTNKVNADLPISNSMQKIGTSSRHFPVFRKPVIRDTAFPPTVITNAPAR